MPNLDQKSSKNGSAFPAQPVATEGTSSAADARGTSDKLSGSDSSAKSKFEEGVGKTREGRGASGGKDDSAHTRG